MGATHCCKSSRMVEPGGGRNVEVGDVVVEFVEANSDAKMLPESAASVVVS